MKNPLICLIFYNLKILFDNAKICHHLNFEMRFSVNNTDVLSLQLLFPPEFC